MAFREQVAVAVSRQGVWQILHMQMLDYHVAMLQ